MRRLLKIGIIACALALISTLILIPFFIDDEALRKTLEEQLSTALGQPVHIEKLSFGLIPYPSLQLANAQTAFGDSADLRLNIRRLRAALSAQALIRGDVVVKRFEIEGVKLNAELLEHIRNLTKGASRNDAKMLVPLRLQRATLHDIVWLNNEGQPIGPWSANLHWEDGLRPRYISFQQEDNRVQGRLDFISDRIDLQIKARDWQAPLAHIPRFESLQLRGHYENDNFTVNMLTANTLGGQISVKGELNWQHAVHVQAELEGNNLHLPNVLSAAHLDYALEGRLTGRCVLTLQADKPAQLFDQPGVNCDLTRSLADMSTHLTLKTEPAKQALHYDVIVQNLLLPVGPPLDFKRVEARGTLATQKIVLNNVHIEGYQGQLDGRGTLSWGHRWELEFVSQGRGLKLGPLLAVFEQRNLDGLLDGECSGKSRAETFTTLLKQPSLNCDLRIADGILYNTDLEQAASLIKRDTDAKGNTPFDHLSTQLQMTKGQVQLDEITIRSTTLEAKGKLSIDPADKLAGEMSVGLKNTGGVVSVPLVVSGVVGEPVFRPTKSAVAGGVAGTAILGPGVGTAIGVKVGEAVQKFSRWLNPDKEQTKAQD